MKKSLFFTLLLLGLVGVLAIAYGATDWRAFESGRNNIRLDGFDGQPGYIAFYDQDGAISGYLYASDDGNLYWTEIDDMSTSGKLGSPPCVACDVQVMEKITNQ